LGWPSAERHENYGVKVGLFHEPRALNHFPRGSHAKSLPSAPRASSTQGIDTTTPAGKAMFQMMGVFAEFERSMIVERVRAGVARAKASGTTTRTR
jgi:hypothetical protein